MRRYRFLRSRKRIEIDITWLCNLSCFDCNRCCGEAPTQDHMTIEQIEQFIDESRRRNHNWEVIRVLGGEPTIHPQFVEIMDLLIEYKRSLPNRGMELSLVVYTNGFSKKSLRLVEELPHDVVVCNTMKDRGPVRHIGHFMVAPQDVRDTSTEDLTMACTHTTTCGLGLTPYGYYHCPIAGSIDRVFGKNLGRRELPEYEDDMNDLMEEFCGLCGFLDMDDESVFVTHENTVFLNERPPVSKSWETAFEKLRAVGSHRLTRY